MFEIAVEIRFERQLFDEFMKLVLQTDLTVETDEDGDTCLMNESYELASLCRKYGDHFLRINDVSGPGAEVLELVQKLKTWNEEQ